MVVQNGNDDSGQDHDYDIVIGAMTDDQIYNYVSDYMDGVITREQFWTLARFKYPTHQIVFCTDAAMKTFQISDKIKAVSRIGIGCMRITGLPDEKAIRELIDGAMELGINFFDHADIYAAGEAEAVFGNVLTPTLREQMVIQTKCAIRPGICYDFSKEHILKSVDGSLKRLKTDYVDILLLHRPDALMEPEEVAEAFDILESSGKVRAFGVSNHNPMQIELLNQYCGGKICIDQLQFSAAHCPTIDASPNAIATAWILRHPAGIQTIAGSTSLKRIQDICRADEIVLTREEWYRIYLAAGKQLP